MCTNERIKEELLWLFLKRKTRNVIDKICDIVENAFSLYIFLICKVVFSVLLMRCWSPTADGQVENKQEEV